MLGLGIEAIPPSDDEHGELGLIVLDILLAHTFGDIDVERGNQLIGLLSRVVVPSSLLVGELCLLSRSFHLVDHQEITGGVVGDGERLVVLGDFALVTRGLTLVPEDILGGALDSVGHLRVAGVPVQGAT